MAFQVANDVGTGTDAELLVLVRKMKAEVLAFGQSYEVEGQTVVRPSLAALSAEEDRLNALINAASGSSSKSKANIASMQRPL